MAAQCCLVCHPFVRLCRSKTKPASANSPVVGFETTAHDWQRSTGSSASRLRLQSLRPLSVCVCVPAPEVRYRYKHLPVASFKL